MSRILVADDEPSIRLVLRDALEGAGHEVVEAADGNVARALLSAQPIDLALLDLRMPGPSGLELLDELRSRGADAPPVVIMTAQNTFENAVEAMKRGAFDYLTKPFELPQLEALIEKVRQQRSLRGEVTALRRRVGEAFRSGEVLVGRTPAMLELFKTIGRVAASDAAVLILGESGTGKEVVARAIHYHSRRREGPFVAVNMTALPSELIEAELFGHERGAYTGAVESRVGRFREAQGGTLLLDEIGDLPLPLQAKLLRVLQERVVSPLGGRQAIPIDVRILASTHRDLEALVREGRFREDLYFRLNVVPLRVAPLRERKADIPHLVAHFVERFADELGVPRRWPGEAALARLQSRSWPGNVRELENAIKRALVLAAGPVLTPDDIDQATAASQAPATSDWAELARRELVLRFASGPEAGEEDGARGPYWSFVSRLERAIIREALAHSRGNRIQAARLLGINRNTLSKKIAELEIGTPDGGDTES
ncbi:MAG: sigma-54-dependent Fis family transcriptional regulator [Deltaproteobacteria bacterium]|nr:sigma-54-dependent Fis family transcriptional regulator [Deltaproteobacteria bacterium]